MVAFAIVCLAIGATMHAFDIRSLDYRVFKLEQKLQDCEARILSLEEDMEDYQ
jgi:hypothetical protein